MEIVRWIIINYGDWDCQCRSGEDGEKMMKWWVWGGGGVWGWVWGGARGGAWGEWCRGRMLGDDRKEKDDEYEYDDEEREYEEEEEGIEEMIEKQKMAQHQRRHCCYCSILGSLAWLFFWPINPDDSHNDATMMMWMMVLVMVRQRIHQNSLLLVCPF